CRKKKLKCDAQQPCSACIKTHSYAVKTHPATAPETPDCTYDTPGGEDPATQAKMQELEAKIKQLEGKLQDQGPSNPIKKVHAVTVTDATTWGNPMTSPSSGTGSGTLGSSPSISSAHHLTPLMGVPMSAVAGVMSGIQSVNGTTPQTSPPQPTAAQIQSSPLTAEHLVQDVNLIFQYFPDTVQTPDQRNGATPSTKPTTEPTPSPPTQHPLLNLVDPHWPEHVPKPELLHHLAETFFACVPHAHRVVHKASFMSSLLHPASSAKFPVTALLHAISAIASLYTPIVTDGSEINLMDIGPDTLFNSAVAPKRMVYDKKQCPDFSKVQIEEGAFGMNQAYYYQETWLSTARQGDRLLQLLQANIIITWYYHSVGRAVDVWICIGNCIRTALPMGLNTGPLWTPISRQPANTLSLFPHGADATEKETLINLFWLVYCMERLYCAGTVWPLLMQDEDISQYLPMSTSNFAFKYIQPSDRQRLNSPKCLTTHPHGMTDSFTLYVKSTVLLGRVKTFNGRFKTKFDCGAVGIDPRETAEFQMLDAAITAFRLSIPKEFKEPTGPDGKVDPTLYLALVIPNVAMLLLHDPHANLDSPNCLSADRMLAAARAILDLIYKLTATSFDLMLLDHSCSFCWFVAATALIRFLKAKILQGDEAETLKLTSEIQVVRFMLQNLGARTIVGLRQNMILEEMYAAEVQPLIDRVVSPPTSDDLSAAAGFFGMF
ncbi:hypothetical protein FRC01_009058, partial [Tulasnella sp. 417]